MIVVAYMSGGWSTWTVESGIPDFGTSGQTWPTRRPPALVVMVGPPGTGKSHLVRRLAERVPLSVVETDEIRRQIAPRPCYSPAENRRVFHMAHKRIDRLLRQGRLVVFDATNLYERSRKVLHRIAESDGARMLIVRTVAPDDVVAERLRRRKAGLTPSDRSEADWDVYLRMKGLMEEVAGPHMVVDTSRELQPAIDEIVGFLKGGETGPGPTR